MTHPTSPAVFGRLEGHEQVVYCSDPQSGLRAIIAIHSTALGPALGGTRYRTYPDEGAALDDVLRLSRAMTYKNALAGLDHGGGKAVIIAPPGAAPTEPLLRAYGRFVNGLAGRYVTAGDMGISVHDLDVVARESRFVTGRSASHGGGGDSGVLTALGVFEGMRACARHRWGAESLQGRTVGVLGLGKVGARLVGHLVADGAQVLAADVDPAAAERVRDAHPQVELLPDPAELLRRPLDVLSPNATGGVLDASAAEALGAQVVCGGANNQLSDPSVADLLAARGILFAPDYLVNSGGVIQVADEWQGYSEDRARAKVLAIGRATLDVLQRAQESGVTPLVAADALVEERISTVSRLGRIWNPVG